MKAPLVPSAVLPSLYIHAGAQTFAIPPKIAYVQIATAPERPPIRPEPWGEPLRSDNFIQLLFRASQPTGMLLQRMFGRQWYFQPYDEVIARTGEGDLLIRQEGDRERWRMFPLAEGAHLFVLGGEMIGIEVARRPARLVEGAIGLYGFLSSFERAEIRKQAAPRPFVAPAGLETRALTHYVLSMELYARHLSTRTGNCLQNANVRWVGELVLHTENDLLKVKNMGRKSIDEVKKILADLSSESGIELSLGMRPERLYGWQPPQG